MRKYFDEQMQVSNIIITTETFSKLKGSPVYGEYQVGDQICLFMEQIINNDNTEPSVQLKLKTVKVIDLDNLKNDYNFDRMDGVYPVLCVKKMKVVNCNTESYDIYIGRPSKWGNPFKIGKDGTRKEVIEKYRDYILSNKELMDSLHELEGKTLGCWCKPKACHGDILVELVSKKGILFI